MSLATHGGTRPTAGVRLSLRAAFVGWFEAIRTVTRSRGWACSPPVRLVKSEVSISMLSAAYPRHSPVAVRVIWLEESVSRLTSSMAARWVSARSDTM